MHSVRKYPIWPRSHRTPKQNVPPHIVFWGGGLPFPHPSIFHMEFVSKPKNFWFLRRKFHFNLNNRFLKARLSSDNFFTLSPGWNLASSKFSGRTLRSTFKISESWPGGSAQKIFIMSFWSNVGKVYDSSSLDKSRVLGWVIDENVVWGDENFLGRVPGSTFQIFWLLTWSFRPENFSNFAKFTKTQSNKVSKVALLTDVCELVEFVLKRWSRIEEMKISGRRVRVRLPKFLILTQRVWPRKFLELCNFHKISKLQN